MVVTFIIYIFGNEELDGPVVTALGVRTRKLSNVLKGLKVLNTHRMGDQNLLSQAPPSFGKHVKPLVPAVFAIVSTHSSFKED
jgi:hypothetical protein